jgi:CxxC motif-containing protein (DUF1111 family)
VIATTGCELTQTFALPPRILRREWTETTARAAVRFAAGKATAGLVAPPVTNLASSILTAMLIDSLKVVAVLAIAVLFASAGLFLAVATAIEFSAETPLRKSRKVTGPLQINSPAAARESTRKTRTGIADQNNKSESATRFLSAQRTAALAVGASKESELAPTPNPLRDGPSLDRGDRSLLPASSDRSLSLNGVDRSPETSLRLGRELFERVWVKNDARSHGGDGLGPVFNGSSCVACHNLGGSGGAGAVDKNIEIVTATDSQVNYMGYGYSFSMDFGAGRFEYRIGGVPQSKSPLQNRIDPRHLTAIHPGFQGARSVMLHRFGVDPTYSAWSESVPGRHGLISVQSSERNPPALFGAGRIDSIPDEAIEAAARRKTAGSLGVKGRVSRLKDGRIGRFGWKAQTASLEDFVLSAAAGEMGLEVPGRRQAADPRQPGFAPTGFDMNREECNLLIDYVRNLAVPVVKRSADDKEATQTKAGEATFKSIGCANCHLPKLGQAEGIYSDLLLHDMGAQLADADTYTVFSGEPSREDRAEADARTRAPTDATSAREWRTPPLWGLRDSAPYLHDGRAFGIAQAVALHAGQAAPSARRFSELSAKRKQQLEAFLMSLAAPDSDQ